MENTTRREYSESDVKEMWAQFAALTVPALILAPLGFWAAGIESWVMTGIALLLTSGFGLGTVWANWLTAALHEARHMCHVWAWGQEGLWPKCMVWIRKYHSLHHKVADAVERSTEPRTNAEQEALNLSSQIGTPTKIYLTWQSFVIWWPPLWIAYILLDWKVLMFGAGVGGGVLFTNLVTENDGHVWHHEPKWQMRNKLSGMLWHYVFSTKACHDRHHHPKTEGEVGSWGSYKWCTTEAMWAEFARYVTNFTLGDACQITSWLTMPLCVLPFTHGWNNVQFWVAFAVPIIQITGAQLHWSDAFAAYAEQHFLDHKKTIDSLLD